MFLFTVFTESGGANKKFFVTLGPFFLVFFDLPDHGTGKDIRKKSPAQYRNGFDHDLWVITNEFNC